ncbi:ABC transporter, ATP-binding protein [Formosa sp. Hel3_A1_48]|jgi:putative ABC transport system permease protein|uniref:ABC transporter permease n=1 Tax=Formosa sp. Hel3_A1_48 TaxID=1336795 RepID=UPI00084E1AD4|nr:ABC transporter permease [Formosa sp. Hel3_A1_48]AOR26243.1 ABC transporter, ATP-binding protein [Formosa sp. Hel3_A1_48]MDC0950009.1 ABC transporter permease [Flavobacteriaceae bacterium]
MFDIDLWREIFQSINKNRTRSLLSGFTVAFAILLFTILFGLANGLNNTFSKAFVDDAANAVYIRSGRTTKANKGLQTGRRIQFKNQDYDYIKSDFDPSIEFITSRVYRNVLANYKNEKNSYSVRAVHPDNKYVEKTKVTHGRYINQRDMKMANKVIIIGDLVREDLFLSEDPIGKYLNLSGIMYKVVGTYIDDGGDDEERLIHMPLSTAQQLYGNNDYVDQINLTYNPQYNYDQAIDFSVALEKKLKERFTVAKNDQRAIRVFNMAMQNKGINQMTSVLGILILIIGMGTLIAGVVGISNIMIFIVKERTKEIGIRKALGASPKAIIAIILVESVVVTTIAGYVGLLAGVGVLEWAGPSLKSYFITDPSVSRSLVIAATITLIAAGTIAGYIPAKKASKIKPIVALRDD